jgi:hypothetical protein
MALPPKDMHLACLRCKAPLGEDDHICLQCGADRRVEMAVAAEIDPEIAALRKWLLILGAISIGVGLLAYEHLHDKVSAGAVQMASLPPIGVGLFMFALCIFARMAPFVVPLLALIVFGASWLVEIVLGSPFALGLNIGTALRVMFILVMVGAMQAGYKARKIREIADEKVARARVVRGA